MDENKYPALMNSELKEAIKFKMLSTAIGGYLFSSEEHSISRKEHLT
jgi:hypothetical protein